MSDVYLGLISGSWRPSSRLTVADRWCLSWLHKLMSHRRCSLNMEKS